jgi:hypothetical protein
LPLFLTDDQQSAVIRAANPLDRTQRDAFIAQLLVAFAGRDEVGDGELFRALRDLQRSVFEPPPRRDPPLPRRNHSQT